MLMYPVGAQSVKCSVCHFVSPVRAGGGGAAGPSRPQPGQQQQAAAQQAGQQQGRTVVIENPPSLDEAGNEVANIAVGIKTDK